MIQAARSHQPLDEEAVALVLLCFLGPGLGTVAEAAVLLAEAVINVPLER